MLVVLADKAKLPLYIILKRKTIPKGIKERQYQRGSCQKVPFSDVKIRDGRLN